MNIRKALALPPTLVGLWLVATISWAMDAPYPSLTPVAENVYAIIGKTEEALPSNGGVVGNYGVIVADDGVILVGTGTSAAYAERLLEDIRQTIGKPVILGINTHQNPAFVFGNGTLKRLGIPVLAHSEVDALIAQRCMRCLKLLNEALGPDAMRGTDVVRPSMVIRDAMTISVGGRLLDILYYGQTSAPGSIAIHDRETGVLFGGGMVSVDRIPDVKDADFSQWRQALANFRALEPARIVPGEGPIIEPARLSELEDYLSGLQDRVKQIYAGRISLAEAPGAASLPRFASWGLYPSLHRKNVEQLYLRLERAALAAD